MYEVRACLTLQKGHIRKQKSSNTQNFFFLFDATLLFFSLEMLSTKNIFILLPFSGVFWYLNWLMEDTGYIWKSTRSH